VTGNRGASGPQGATGAQGATGTKNNVTGNRGASGPQGAAGVQGSTGTLLIGTRGANGPQGAAGQQGSRGNINKTTGTRGAQGPQGAAGAQGSRGTLLIGTRGANGPQGASGAQGSTGTKSTVTGNRGASGPQGAQGPQGSAGLQGSTGTAGVVGASGTLVNLQKSSSKGYLVGKNSESDGWNGTFYVSSAYAQNGVLYEGSDERWKNILGDISIDFEQVREIPKKYYQWKDKNMGEDTQIGTTAQGLAKVFPELVNTDENGYMSVAYDRLSIIALAAIDKLVEENENLKAEIEKIKEMI
jgi:hypothetical protein